VCFSAGACVGATQRLIDPVNIFYIHCSTRACSAARFEIKTEADPQSVRGPLQGFYGFVRGRRARAPWFRWATNRRFAATATNACKDVQFILDVDAVAVRSDAAHSQCADAAQFQHCAAAEAEYAEPTDHSFGRWHSARSCVTSKWRSTRRAIWCSARRALYVADRGAAESEGKPRENNADYVRDVHCARDVRRDSGGALSVRVGARRALCSTRAKKYHTLCPFTRAMRCRA